MALIEQGVPLGRLTTVGIGGPAQHFARPQTLGELEEALRWAAAERLEVFTIGLGSNVLVADEGVDGLVLRLEGQLALAETKEGLLVAGGGAANAVCLHRTRAAGLGGFEFGCAIPGTVGGGVRMNAGAYGGDWRGRPDGRGPPSCPRRIRRRARARGPPRRRSRAAACRREPVGLPAAAPNSGWCLRLASQFRVPLWSLCRGGPRSPCRCRRAA